MNNPAGRAPFPIVLVTGLCLSAVLLFLFGWLASEVVEAETMAFDDGLRNALHQFASPPLTAAMKALSFLGSLGWLLPLTVLLVLFFAGMRRHKMAVLWIVAMAGVVLLDVILKHSFHRSRPTAFFGTSPQSYSFPSGHALASLCFYSLLARNIWVNTAQAWTRAFIVSTAVLLVAGIGLSRVYLGVHYPTDVLAGYLAAGLWVGTVGLVEKRLYPIPAPAPASEEHGPDRNTTGL